MFRVVDRSNQTLLTSPLEAQGHTQHTVAVALLLVLRVLLLWLSESRKPKPTAQAQVQEKVYKLCWTARAHGGVILPAVSWSVLAWHTRSHSINQGDVGMLAL